MERQSRTSNAIIINIKEPTGGSSTERIADDVEVIMKIFEKSKININGKKIFRLGQFELDKNRPIKVFLNSPEDALWV